MASLFFILPFSLDPWPSHTHCMLKVKEPLVDNFNTVAGFVPILKSYIREVGAQYAHTCMCIQAYTCTPTHTGKHTYTYTLVSHKKVFSTKTSACRDGTLKIPTKLDGNDATILSHHPHILCHFANYALCLLFVCIGGLWKAVECIGSDAWECIVHD